MIYQYYISTTNYYSNANTLFLKEKCTAGKIPVNLPAQPSNSNKVTSVFHCNAVLFKLFSM
jgi:hypothetical protein